MKTFSIVVSTILFQLALPGAILVGDEPGQLDRDSDASPRIASVSHLTVDHLRKLNGEVQEYERLRAVLELADASYQFVCNDIRDYTCTVVVRERVKGRLQSPRYLDAKVRHQRIENGKIVTPLSIYVKFKAPEEVKQREVLYVDGQNDGKLLVRNGGARLAFLVLSLDPTGRIAMHDSLYPITELGIKRLIQRIADVGKRELVYNEHTVTLRDDVKLHDRVCTRIDLTHPKRRDHFESHLARIYVDNELKIPIRYESYDWPAEGSDDPVLLAEYTYLDLKLNVGLTDADFDKTNPAYQFR
ncbi:hypothetical protein Pla52o_16630 [Novipirellula galeiformis]|uniref:DUF1571 domain-containing protein n=1 Tax=Novipirellula galeiformis TaxID=2528004 RepID=A0A5C6CLY7_9BACT|nr:DUF1571 domain-containing protein [Novipirellula galeiformis]TWU25362.1 hypothetical protein Pla52o_16630 [Novipirellula galeiformis]